MPLRPPRPPHTTLRTPRLPRLNLAPLRSNESLQLDHAANTGYRTPLEDVPYITWEQFLDLWNYEQGEHVTIVGATGSGKTTLARKIILKRTYICVLATKTKDQSLYPKLAAEGFQITENPRLDYTQTPRVIFRPHLDAPTKDAQDEQKDQFQALLLNIFREGGWELYGDEIRYLTQTLKLNVELETLWLQGRSLGVSIVVSTQRPVSIPVLAFESATHLFLFRMTDRVNIQRAAEFAGAEVDTVRYILPRLPRYEVLYIDTRTGEMLRTKVRL